jgi:hypothetical protein
MASENFLVREAHCSHFTHYLLKIKMQLVWDSSCYPSLPHSPPFPGGTGARMVTDLPSWSGEASSAHLSPVLGP